MREEYDVIIVGAGPGGSIAARTAAEECDVLLLEKRQEIGAPVRCAECVDKNSLLEFIQPERKWIADEITHVKIYAPDGTTLEGSLGLFGNSEEGYVLERKVFDRELAKNASRAGAHVMVRTRATGLIKEGDTIKGVKLNRLGENFEVHSKVVIGADGVESKVGRWGGINTTLKLKDIESCVQYHMTNVDGLEDIIGFYPGSTAPSGYTWTFPKGDHAVNVGLGVLGSRLSGKRPIDYLNEFVAKHFPEGQPVELMMGGVPASDQLKTITRDGLMLVGDAAHHNDPLTGGGIINAMVGGRIAGEVASKAVHKNDASIKVLKEYETGWYEWWGKWLKHRYKIKEFYTHTSDEEFNKLIRVVKCMWAQEKTKINIWKWSIRAFKSNPKLLFVMRHLPYLM